MRVLTICFRRDSSRDRSTDNDIALNGYQLSWPDGRPVDLGMDAFCRHAERVLGLQRFLTQSNEQSLELIVFPLPGPEAPFTRRPGMRIRRFMLQRQGRLGRIHLVNGHPTAIVFDLDRDERKVLDWIGLSRLRDGESAWFDFGPRLAETDLPLLVPALRG